MPARFAAAVALFYVPLVLAALAWIGWRAGAEGLVERLAGAHPLRDLALGTAVGVGCALASRLLARLVPVARRLERGLVELIGPLSPGACAVLALISGFAEEIVFRAALQPEIGLVWASLIFGAVHAPMRRDLLAWPALAALMGLLLGGLYDWTGGCVLAPAAAHVAVNWVNLLHLSRRARELPPPPLPSEPGAAAGRPDDPDAPQAPTGS